MAHSKKADVKRQRSQVDISQRQGAEKNSRRQSHSNDPISLRDLVPRGQFLVGTMNYNVIKWDA